MSASRRTCPCVFTQCDCTKKSSSKREREREHKQDGRADLGKEALCVTRTTSTGTWSINRERVRGISGVRCACSRERPAARCHSRTAAAGAHDEARVAEERLRLPRERGERDGRGTRGAERELRVELVEEQVPAHEAREHLAAHEERRVDLHALVAVCRRDDDRQRLPGRRGARGRRCLCGRSARERGRRAGAALVRNEQLWRVLV